MGAEQSHNVYPEERVSQPSNGIQLDTGIVVKDLAEVDKKKMALSKASTKSSMGDEPISEESSVPSPHETGAGVFNNDTLPPLLVGTMSSDADAAAIESNRRNQLLLDHKTTSDARSTGMKSKKKGLATKIFGERMTPEKLAEQQAEFDKLQRRSLSKRGQRMPEESALEMDTSRLIGLILKYGKKFEDGTILITFGEVIERYDQAPYEWSRPCADVLLHAALFARLKYTACGSTWVSRPGSPTSTHTPRLALVQDDDAIIELANDPNDLLSARVSY